jgi:hypothetical protein
VGAAAGVDAGALGRHSDALTLKDLNDMGRLSFIGGALELYARVRLRCARVHCCLELPDPR